MAHSRFEKMKGLMQVDLDGVENAKGAKTKSRIRSKKPMPLIKCECGTEILLLPDLKAMDRAIQAHVARHRKKGNDSSKAATSRRVSELLPQLSLQKASECH